MEAKDLLGILELEPVFRPVVKKAVEILKTYGPDIHDLVRSMEMGITEIKIDQVKKIEAAGFSRDDALLLVQDEWFAIARALRNTNSKNANKGA